MSLSSRKRRALCRTRTDDPFLTMEGSGCFERSRTLSNGHEIPANSRNTECTAVTDEIRSSWIYWTRSGRAALSPFAAEVSRADTGPWRADTGPRLAGSGGPPGPADTDRAGAGPGFRRVGICGRIVDRRRRPPAAAQVGQSRGRPVERRFRFSPLEQHDGWPWRCALRGSCDVRARCAMPVGAAVGLMRLVRPHLSA